MYKKIGLPFIFILLNLALVFLALVVIEIRDGMIDADYQQKVRNQVRPYYRWSFYSSDGVALSKSAGPLKLEMQPFLVYKNVPGQKEKNFSTNSLGLRGADIRKEPAKKRIILIGGSAAFGTGLHGDEETMASQLARLTHAEVINAGVIGYKSGQELVYLLTELVDLKPDLVIALNGWNDYTWLEEGKGKPYACNGFDQVDSQLKRFGYLTAGSLTEKTKELVYLLFPNVIARLENIGLLKKAAHQASTAPKASDIEKIAGIYAGNLSKMNILGKSFHYHFLCLIQPQKNIPELKEKVDLYRAFRDQSKLYLDSQHVRYIDLNGEAFKNIFPPDRFMDEMHLDAQGNLRLAETVAEIIRSKKLL